MGDVPAIGSILAGADLRVVGVTTSTGPGSILLARDGSGIKTLKDLKGKKVAYTTGTAQQGFALRALKTVGLAQKDVQQIDVPLQDLPSVLESGAADASVVSVEAQLKYIDAHPGAVSLVTSKDLKPYVGGFFLASAKALRDPATADAIYELLAARIRAARWVEANQATWATEYYVKERKQPADYAKRVAAANGVTSFVPITDAVIGLHQELVDLLVSVGGLPSKVDVKSLYDPQVVQRVNDVIKKVGG
jgi:sulfonate transport system substrate-binding protein